MDHAYIWDGRGVQVSHVGLLGCQGLLLSDRLIPDWSRIQTYMAFPRIVDPKVF